MEGALAVFAAAHLGLHSQVVAWHSAAAMRAPSIQMNGYGIPSPYGQGFYDQFPDQYDQSGQYGPFGPGNQFGPGNPAYYGTVVPTSAAATAPPLDNPPHIEGLSSLVEYLSPETQDAALRYCVETDTPSVQVLVLMGADDSFLASLGVEPGGNTDTILRDRIASLRRGLGAKSFDRPRAPPVPRSEGYPGRVPTQGYDAARGAYREAAAYDAGAAAAAAGAYPAQAGYPQYGSGVQYSGGVPSANRAGYNAPAGGHAPDGLNHREYQGSLSANGSPINPMGGFRR